MVLRGLYFTALGLLLTAGPPAFADDIIPPKILTVTPTGINLSDSSFTYQSADIAFGSLSLERFYIGGDLETGNPVTRNHYAAPWFGPRMSHNYDIFVKRVRKPKLVYPETILTIYEKRTRDQVYMGQSSKGPYTEGGYSGNGWLDEPANGSIPAWSPDASVGELSASSGWFIYTLGDGTIYTFDKNVNLPSVPQSGAMKMTQRATSILYPNGRKVSLAYDASKRLKLISDNQGYALSLDYDANSHITAVCGFNLSQDYVTTSTTCSGAAYKATYGYAGAAANLASYTDPLGQVTTYGRGAITGHDQNQISCITPPGSTDCQIANTNDKGFVTQQTLADGTVWNYNGGGSSTCTRSDSCLVDQGQNITIVEDPLGKSSTYTFTKSSPYKFTDANGKVTEYTFTGGQDDEDILEPYPYETGSLLQSAKFPEGDEYHAQYYGPFMSISGEWWTAKPGSGLANRVKTYGYATCTSSNRKNCAKPIWVKDPKGNQTDYTYDDAHGGMLSEMQPASTSGEARPLKLSTYAQRYAYIKNSGGTFVAAASPIWMPATDTQCQTATGGGVNTPVCDSVALQVVTTYEYGATGTGESLLVKGVAITSGSDTLRTCYSYDNQGRKVSETKPNANLTSCP